MKIIVSQPYIKIIRTICDKKQYSIETEEFLHLYPDKIYTPTNVFQLQHVFDMSFRKINQLQGFLYLHTNQGVFSYNVTQDPFRFIDEYKRLRS